MPGTDLQVLLLPLAKEKVKRSRVERLGVSQAGLKCSSLIVKQHVVMATANGESDNKKERTT